MEDNVKLLGDMNDKVACRDEILFDIVCTVEYIDMLEKHVDRAIISSQAYTDHVYYNAADYPVGAMPSRAIIERENAHDRRTDLRLLNFAERIAKLEAGIEHKKEEYAEHRKRLVRITKQMHEIITANPFLEAYKIFDN